MTHAIEIKGLTKRFGGVLALDNVDLAAAPGDFVALLGPSGCGKSTLLRCIAGFETPDDGEIAINGRTVYSARAGIFVPPGERGLGMVFQSYALWPHMRVGDNVGFGLELQGLAKADRRERVRAALGDVGLDELADRYPSQLSGGQQQRVALARLLACRPDVFLMDEPLSNLDARLRMDMRSELKRLHRQSKALTLYVTHDQGEAMSMADTVVVMRDGRIEQAAGPEQIYRQPGTLFVADFVGMPRMNTVPGIAARTRGRLQLDFAGLSVTADWLPGEGRFTVGFRPEDLLLSTAQAAGAAEFRVRAVLPSGPEVIVQLARGEHATLYARETRRLDLSAESRVWARIDPASINVFDPESGILVSPMETAAEQPRQAQG